MVSNLYSLSFETTTNYDVNLQTVLDLIQQADDNSIVVAPEVCLTGYDYDNFEEMYKFADITTQAIKKVSKNKIIILTMLEKQGDRVYNIAKIFYDTKVVHEQAKVFLFKFGEEHHYMHSGNIDDIAIVEVAGVKIGILICFELRFKELWQKLEGCDVIALPAWWGRLRTQNFKTLTQALAVMNQCYVVASDSLNEECTGQSGIITPFGEVQRNKKTPLLKVSYDIQEIKKMRRYMDIGIK
jgi:predicted amidohydrolase